MKTRHRLRRSLVKLASLALAVYVIVSASLGHDHGVVFWAVVAAGWAWLAPDLLRPVLRRFASRFARPF